jgi:aspartate/glutamate racemase
MHIGLIGGIGPAATDYYYRGLIEGHAAASAANPKFAPQLPRVRLRTSGSKRH